MIKHPLQEHIEKCHAVYRQAALELLAAVEKFYPVGATVKVTLRKTRVAGIVFGHGGADDPGRVWIQNVKTGRLLKFSALHPETYDPMVYIPVDQLQLQGKKGL